MLESRYLLFSVDGELGKEGTRAWLKEPQVCTLVGGYEQPPPWPHADMMLHSATFPWTYKEQRLHLGHVLGAAMIGC